MPAPFTLNRNLRLFNAFAFVRDLTPILAIWVVYLTDYRHLTLAQVGLMEGMFWGVKLLAEIPSGTFADRYGRRAAMLTAVAFEALGLIIFGFASSFPLLAFSYVLWAIGLAFRSGSSEAYLYDALTTANREAEYTRRLGLFSAINISSTIIGGIIGGVLAVITNLQIAVLATALSYALAAPLLLLLQEPPHRRNEGPRRPYRATLRTGLLAVRDNPPVRGILLLQIALSASMPAYILLCQPFMAAHHVPLALFGVLSAPVPLLSALGGLSSDRITRRLGLHRVLALAIAGAVTGLAILAAINHVTAFAGFALTALSLAITMPAIGAYVNARTDSQVRATVLSIAPFGESLVFVIVSMIAGVVGDISLRLAFAGLALTVLTLATAAYLLWRAATPTPIEG